jgi:dihydrofolate synthase/folylpolyglutamate synthase
LLISGANEKNVIAQAREHCRKTGSPCVVSDLKRVKNLANSENPPEICLDMKDIYKLAMNGEFQKRNFILAVSALETLGFNTDRKVVEAIAKTSVAGRTQKVEAQGKTIILDVAHNPQAMENFVKALEALKPRKPVSLIIGMMSDKDVPGTIKFVRDAADFVFCFTPATRRALPADYLARDFTRLGAKNVSVCRSPKDALEKALAAGETVVASGSFYVVSEVMAAANIEIRE